MDQVYSRRIYETRTVHVGVRNSLVSIYRPGNPLRVDDFTVASVLLVIRLKNIWKKEEKRREEK